MVSDVYWFISESATKLRNVSYNYCIKAPQKILIKRYRSFLDTYLYAICEKIILPYEIFFLNRLVESRVRIFVNQHKEKPGSRRVTRKSLRYCC
jgi:hypothetical protein